MRLFRLLPKHIASDVFSEISHREQHQIIAAMTDKEQAFIINDMFADDAADLIEEMPPKVVKRLLENATPETRQEINLLLKYPDGCAGSIMTTEYVKFKTDETVKQAFDAIRKYGTHKETIYTCYVVDDTKTLIGFVSVKDLIFADQKQTIGEIMRDSVMFVHTLDDTNTVQDMFAKYGFLSLPVVDSENKLVGIITFDDVIDTVKEKHTEQIHLMAGVTPNTDTPYLKTSVMRHSRDRITWLLLLMLSAIFTGLVISKFEMQLSLFPILIAFIPMLMDAGGNAGSQSSAQIIRGMAIGEISAKDTLVILWKEIRVALICGVILGIVNFIRVVFLEGLIMSSVNAEILRVATVVTLSLCSTIIMAKILGGLLPIAAKAMKMDPAVMAAPLITTILDVLSLLVYFSIATIILGI
jgi:magnesium transporter